SDAKFKARYGNSTDADSKTKAYRLLGIDPDSELYLAALASEDATGQGFSWYAGITDYYLDDTIAVQSVVALAANDDTLRQAFSSALSQAQDIVDKMSLAGDARAQALQTTQEYPNWYNVADVFSPVASGGQADQLCQYLQSKVAGSTGGGGES